MSRLTSIPSECGHGRKPCRIQGCGWHAKRRYQKSDMFRLYSVIPGEASDEPGLGSVNLGQPEGQSGQWVRFAAGRDLG